MMFFYPIGGQTCWEMQITGQYQTINAYQPMNIAILPLLNQFPSTSIVQEDCHQKSVPFYQASQSTYIFPLQMNGEQFADGNSPENRETAIQTDQKDMFEIKMSEKLKEIHKNGDYCPEAWLPEHDHLLIQLSKEKKLPWKLIRQYFPDRSRSSCYTRLYRLRGKSGTMWTEEDKQAVIRLVEKYGHNWKIIQRHLKKFEAHQIRERYINSIRPGLKKGRFTAEEDWKIIKFVEANGTKWKALHQTMPNRSEGWLKSRYYRKLEEIIHQVKKQIKREKQQGQH